MKKKLKNDNLKSTVGNILRKIFFATTIIFSLFIFYGCKGEKSSDIDAKEKAAEKKLYTCSMHPEVIRDKHGDCPICGMHMIEKTEGVTLDTTIIIADVVKPTNESVISNVKIITVKETTVSPFVTAIGSVEYDTRRFINIAARVGGRIEKLYIKYRYQSVQKDEKLYDIYSPDLQTEVRNLIYLLNNDNANTALINSSKLKLKLLGLSQEQLDEISKSKKATATLSIYSPADGYVIDEVMTSAPASSSVQTEAMPQSVTQSSKTFSIKEGQYVKQGETVFKVINTQQVWAVMKVYAGEINQIKKGQQIKLVMNNFTDDTMTTQIDFVEPVFSSGSKFLNLRAYLNNKDNNFKRGDLFKAFIQPESISGIWIPRTAMIDLGNQQVVYMKDRNMFYAHKISTGMTSGKNILVMEGLKDGNTIAENAQYLMDSESFIKIKHNEN